MKKVYDNKKKYDNINTHNLNAILILINKKNINNFITDLKKILDDNNIYDNSLIITSNDTISKKHCMLCGIYIIYITILEINETNLFIENKAIIELYKKINKMILLNELIPLNIEKNDFNSTLSAENIKIITAYYNKINRDYCLHIIKEFSNYNTCLNLKEIIETDKYYIESILNNEEIYNKIIESIDSFCKKMEVSNIENKINSILNEIIKIFTEEK